MAKFKKKRERAQNSQKQVRGSGAPQRAVWLFFGLFLLALMVRVLFLSSNPDRDWSYSIFYYGDALHYHQYAASLLKGEAYDQGVPYHPPMFAWLMAFLYELFGAPRESGYVFKVVLAVIQSLTVAFAAWWYRKMLPGRWGIVAALLNVFYFGTLVFSVTFNNEVLYELFVLSTVAVVSIAAADFSLVPALVLAFCMAAGSLTKAEHLTLWPFLLFYLYRQRSRAKPLRKWLINAAMSIVVSLLLLLPWCLHNASIIAAYNKLTPDLEPIPRFHLVTAYGPVNFALANNRFSDGGFNPDLMNQFTGAATIDLKFPQHRYLFIHGYSEGMSFLVAHPREAATLIGIKLARWLNGLSIGFGVSDWPGGLNGVRAPVDLFVSEEQFLKWPVILLLLSGIALSFRSRYSLLSVCSLVLLHRMLVTVLFFGYARGMAIMFPMIAPLLLLPAIWVEEQKYCRLEVYAFFGALAFSALLLLQTLWIGADGVRNYGSSGSLDGRGKLIQDARVKLWPE